MEDKICPNCGVILDGGLDMCPLCQSEQDEKKYGKNKEMYPGDILDMSEKQSRIYAWELSAIIGLSANLICIIVDLVINKGIDWSLYAITAITGLWLFITSVTFLNNKPLLLALNMSVITLGMLIIIDTLSPPVNWFIGLGLPVSLSFWLLFALFLFILRYLKWKGFNMLAYIFIEVSAMVIIIDIFTDLYFRDKVFIDWSAITAATLVPVAGILFFMHYRMKRGKDLSSFFHV